MKAMRVRSILASKVTQAGGYNFLVSVPCERGKDCLGDLSFDSLREVARKIETLSDDIYLAQFKGCGFTYCVFDVITTRPFSDSEIEYIKEKARKLTLKSESELSPVFSATKRRMRATIRKRHVVENSELDKIMHLISTEVGPCVECRPAGSDSVEAWVKTSRSEGEVGRLVDALMQKNDLPFRVEHAEEEEAVWGETVLRILLTKDKERLELGGVRRRKKLAESISYDLGYRTFVEWREFRCDEFCQQATYTVGLLSPLSSSVRKLKRYAEQLEKERDDVVSCEVRRTKDKNVFELVCKFF